MCLCKFGQNPPIGSGDKSADKKLCGSQADPRPQRLLRKGGHKNWLIKRIKFLLPLNIFNYIFSNTASQFSHFSIYFSQLSQYMKNVKSEQNPR